MKKFLILAVLIALLLAGIALGQNQNTDIATGAAEKVASIVCPIVNVLTGVVGRLIILVLIAVAVVMYFAFDSRSAKGLAITAVIGAILLMNFASIQKLFTGYNLNTSNKVLEGSRIVGDTIYCR